MIAEAEFLAENGDPKPMKHNPLEQFILLAKGTRGAACCDLIKTVLEAPGVYVFAELIGLPNMQEVRSFLGRLRKNRLNLSFLLFIDYRIPVEWHTECQIFERIEFVCSWHVQRVFGTSR